MVEKIALISSVLLGISEALSLIPSIKSNGIVQLVINLLKSIAGK
jgi:hypothetical protein